MKKYDPVIFPIFFGLMFYSLFSMMFLLFGVADGSSETRNREKCRNLKSPIYVVMYPAYKLGCFLGTPFEKEEK